MTTLFPVADPVALSQTVEGILSLCDESLAHAKTLSDEIRALESAQDDQLTWDATYDKLDRIVQALQEAVCTPQLMSVVHPDAALRTATEGCEPKVNSFVTALYLDDALASVFRRAQVIITNPDAVQKKFIEETLREYRRNGLELDAAGRAKLTELNEAITRLGQAFDKNLAEAVGFIEVTPEQLEGLPASFRDNHPVGENGLVRITTNYPDFVPFMKYAKDREHAGELYKINLNRAADKNLTLLDELILRRKEKATLLGYPTWADYVLEPRMAKTSETVRVFLQDLHTRLHPLALKEFTRYQEMNQTLFGTKEPIPASNSAYLEDKICEADYAYDSQKLSEYFEIKTVQQGIFDITSRLYNVSFHKSDAPRWHEDVEVFDVRDDATQTILGHAYIDLYPREDKYKHAAVFGLRDTRRNEDGSRELPFGALVCNFPKPGASPALLSHDDVTTFFHEFGHLLHHIFSQSAYSSFSGTNVARDFVEAPSQMFEEWAWKRETLDLFARHHATGEKIPQDLFDAMTKARLFGEALMNERQIFLATLDQTYHTREPGFDTGAVVEELHPLYSPFTRIPGTHFQATFGHLIGYDAAYYGYQWARSIAFDLFTRFTNEGMLNTQTAKDYREKILAKGGSADEASLVADFLGRPTSPEAYAKFLGI